MSTQPKRRILIVDDDPTIVQMLSDILSDEGYKVSTATQSLRAFDRAREAKPDLILMDIMMPYLDGFDQLKLFSLDHYLSLVPAIVITAEAHSLDGVDTYSTVILNTLYKPFEVYQLLEKLRMAFSGQDFPADLVRLDNYLPDGNVYQLGPNDHIELVYSQTYCDQYPKYRAIVESLKAALDRRNTMELRSAIRKGDNQPDPNVFVYIKRSGVKKAAY